MLQFGGVLAVGLLAGACSLGGAGCAHRPSPAEATPTLELVRVISLPGLTGTRTNVGVPGRIDHFAYDPLTRRLFVAALENGSLEVIDTEAGQRVRSLTGLSRPQGAAVVPDRGVVAVATGGDGRLHVYDTRSLEKRATLDIGPDADNVRYDGLTDTLLVSHGSTNAGAITILSPATWVVTRRLEFTSRPESFQLDPAGHRLFANLPESIRAVKEGKVAVVDRRTGLVERWIPLPDRTRNYPMAYDPAQDRVFLATRRPARLMVIDLRAGAVTAEAACIDDSDDVFFDQVTGLVMVVGGGFRPDLQTPEERSATNPPGEMGAVELFTVDRTGRPHRIASEPLPPHARTGLWVASRRTLYVAAPMRGERDAEVREYRLR